MSLLLTVSYVLHVVAGLFWIGMTLYVAYALLPAARNGGLSGRAFGFQTDVLLQTTRITGVVLPVTGLYQVWLLYPQARLLGTTDGYLVLAMFALWGLLNGTIEFGTLRMRQRAGDNRPLWHFVVRFPREIPDDAVGGLLSVGRPYFLASLAFAVLLVVNAGLLAA